MRNIELVHELLDMALCIQSWRNKQKNHPYVKFSSTDYGVEIFIIDGGIDSRRGYDGEYRLSFEEVEGRTYRNCKEHLQDLIKQIGD